MARHKCLRRNRDDFLLRLSSQNLLVVEPGNFVAMYQTQISQRQKIKTDPKGRFKFSGRGERIRTSDTLVPNQVLYQTELRPEGTNNYNFIFINCKYIFKNILFYACLFFAKSLKLWVWGKRHFYFLY